MIASLNSARTKGKYAAIKSNLRNAVSQAAIYYATNGTYTGLCDDSTVLSIITSLGPSAVCFDDYSSPIADVDFGLAISYEGEYFIAGPLGVFRYMGGFSISPNSWNDAQNTCGNSGGVLGGLSALRGLRDISGGVPAGFSSNHTWTGTENNTGYVYRINMSTGAISANTKTTTGATESVARCFSST